MSIDTQNFYSGPIVTRSEAGGRGDTHYFTGKPCSKGHVAERFVSSYGCVVCSAQSSDTWHANNPEKARSKVKKYNQTNPEKRKESVEKWKAKNPEKIKKYRKDSYEINKDERLSRAKRASLARAEKLAGRPKPGNCEICNRLEIPGEVKSRIVFDHSHTSGEFRGWICHCCNIALGHVEDSMEVLRKMIQYLRVVA